MTDVLNRIGALLTELQTIGCDVAIDDARISLTVYYHVVDELDAATARRIVDEVAAEPPPEPRTTAPRRNHGISPVTGAKRTGKGFPATVDYAEVARIANDAMTKGQSAARAVMQHYGLTRSAAYMRISSAREKGHKIPRAASPLGPAEVGAPQRRVNGQPVPPPPAPARTSLDAVAALDAQIGHGDDD